MVSSGQSWVLLLESEGALWAEASGWWSDPLTFSAKDAALCSQPPGFQSHTVTVVV